MELLRDVIGRLGGVGVDPGDTAETRLQKASLTLAATSITVLASVCVAIYWGHGLAMAEAVRTLPPAVRVPFFVLNVVAVTGTSFVLLRYVMAQRDGAQDPRARTVPGRAG